MRTIFTLIATVGLLSFANAQDAPKKEVKKSCTMGCCSKDKEANCTAHKKDGTTKAGKSCCKTEARKG